MIRIRFIFFPEKVILLEYIVLGSISFCIQESMSSCYHQYQPILPILHVIVTYCWKQPYCCQWPHLELSRKNWDSVGVDS